MPIIASDLAKKQPRKPDAKPTQILVSGEELREKWDKMRKDGIIDMLALARTKNNGHYILHIRWL